MNIASILAWLRQPTSVLGISGLVSTAAAVASGQLSPSQAVVPVIGSLTLILVPDNAVARRDIEKLVRDAAAAAQAPSAPTVAAVVADLAVVAQDFAPLPPPPPAPPAAALVLLLAAGLGLGACATGTQPSAKQALFAAEEGYTAALVVADAYAALPACVPGGPALCSDPAVVAKVAAAATAAQFAVAAAEAVVNASQAPTPEAEAAAVADAVKAAADIQTAVAGLKVR